MDIFTTIIGIVITIIGTSIIIKKRGNNNNTVEKQIDKEIDRIAKQFF
jgi:hypothetical protein